MTLGASGATLNRDPSDFFGSNQRTTLVYNGLFWCIRGGGVSSV